MAINDFKNLMITTHDEVQDNGVVADMERIILKNKRYVFNRVQVSAENKDENEVKNLLEQEITWAKEDHEHAIKTNNGLKVAVTQHTLRLLNDFYTALKK